MDAELEQLLVEQGGVVRRAQARDLGMPSTQLGEPGAGRQMTRVRPGVYAKSAAYDAADQLQLITLQVRAERLVSSVDLVAVGATAALLHELPLIGKAPTRPRLAERKPDRPRHHGSSTTLAPEDVVDLHGISAATMARAALDVARDRGRLAGVVAIDAALRKGVSREDLQRTLARSTRWPGVRQARAALDLADGRSESALESLGRVRFHEHGLPAPDLQVWLGDVHGAIARVDHYWAEHRTVAEADGALKYMSPEDLFAEKRREDRLREAGFEVVRYTWDEVLRTPEVVVARLLAAFARAATRAA